VVRIDPKAIPATQVVGIQCGQLESSGSVTETPVQQADQPSKAQAVDPLQNMLLKKES